MLHLRQRTEQVLGKRVVSPRVDEGVLNMLAAQALFPRLRWLPWVEAVAGKAGGMAGTDSKSGSRRLLLQKTFYPLTSHQRMDPPPDTKVETPDPRFTCYAWGGTFCLFYPHPGYPLRLPPRPRHSMC